MGTPLQGTSAGTAMMEAPVVIPTDLLFITLLLTGLLDGNFPSFKDVITFFEENSKTPLLVMLCHHISFLLNGKQG